MTTARRNILVIGPSWVGDMVMAQCLFQTLLAQEPNVQISVLAPAWSLPLLSRIPEVTTAIPAPFKHGQLSFGHRLHLARHLRAHQFDQAIVLPLSFKAALVPFLAGIPTRTGFLGEQRYGLLNDIRPFDPKRLPQTVQRFVQLGLPPNSESKVERHHPQLVVHSQNMPKLFRRLGINPSGRPALALCPGAAFGPAKRWPAAHFSKVAQEQLKQGWQVWLIGSHEDAVITGEIYGQGRPYLYDLAGHTSLEDTIDLLSTAACVVSNDSGLMHVAAAVGPAVIALYGSTSPDINPPLSPRATILWEHFKCSPCHQRVCPLDHTNCLNHLSVNQVLNALRQALPEGPTGIKLPGTSL